MENALYSMVLILTCLAMFGLTYVSWRICRETFYAAVLVDIVFFFVFVKLTLYYALPTVLRILSNYQFEIEDGVSVSSVVRLYLVELVSWFFWHMGLSFLLRRSRRQPKPVSTNELFARHRFTTRLLLVIVSLGSIPAFLTSMTFYEGNLSLEVFKVIFFNGGLVTGPFLLIVGRKRFGIAYQAVGLVTTVISILTLSTRGAIVYLILICLFFIVVVQKDRKQFAVYAIIAVILALSYFAFDGLVTGKIVVSPSGGMGISANVDTTKKGERTNLEEIEWRFGAATRMGTAFFSMYDRGDSAGVNPIIHSLQGILPRSIYPDKPYPSTLRGDDPFSQGSYLIYKEVHGYETSSMVEFPTGAHFYWEFGWFGVFFLSLISGLYIALCVRWLALFGAASIPLIVVFFKPWGYVDPKIWVSDIALQLYQVVLPLALLIAIVSAIEVIRDQVVFAGHRKRFRLR